MKAAIQAIYANPKYAKAFEWGKLISITGGAQIIIQAIGLVSGILIVRLLPTQEYALYTIANTMLGTMAVLADGGIAIGVMAAGGKIWNDYQKLGTVVSTGLHLRRTFALVSFLIVTPILFYLLHHHGASILLSFLIALSILPAFLTTIHGTLLQIPLKLHQSIRPLQKNQLENSALRLLILCLTLFIFPWAGIALLAAGVPQIWANKRLKRLAYSHANLRLTPDKQVREEIMSSVKRILPDAIYYCLSGQLTIWLISIFGQTISVAQVGALTRFNASLSLLTVLFSTLIIPRFARLSSSKNLQNIYINTLLTLTSICLGVIGIFWLASDQLLFLLGTNYKQLKPELILCIIGGCLSTLIGITFNLYTSRGFAIRPTILIPLNIVANVIGITFIDYSTLHGVLIFNIFVNGVQLLVHFSYGFCKLRFIEFNNKSQTYSS